MKKMESLKLSKFKNYELTKENHNQVLGGKQGLTGAPGGCQIKDNFDDSTVTKNGGGQGVDTYPKKDISPAFVIDIPTANLL